MIQQYINKLIENLPDNLKNSDNPLIIDLILDGGVFNGSYIIGALYFLKEMENRNYIRINRISGCSVGAIAGYLYLVDGLHLFSKFYEIVNINFKKNYTLKCLKNIKKYLSECFKENVCEKINNKLFITYNNVKKCKKIVKSTYKSYNNLINTIFKSFFFPYLINGDLLYKNKYLDGISPYIFVPDKNTKVIYLELFCSDKIFGMINIKNEKTNFHRVLAGLLDIHNFFIKESRTSMCSYVNDWSIIDRSYYKVKNLIEQLFVYIIYFILILKKYLSNDLKDTIIYKLLSKIFSDIFIVLLETYCL
jgi:hypothetical protein